jgi:hypothetical protein
MSPWALLVCCDRAPTKTGQIGGPTKLHYRAAVFKQPHPIGQGKLAARKERGPLPLKRHTDTHCSSTASPTTWQAAEHLPRLHLS